METEREFAGLKFQLKFERRNQKVTQRQADKLKRKRLDYAADFDVGRRKKRTERGSMEAIAMNALYRSPANGDGEGFCNDIDSDRYCDSGDS